MRVNLPFYWTQQQQIAYGELWDRTFHKSDDARAENAGFSTQTTAALQSQTSNKIPSEVLIGSGSLVYFLWMRLGSVGCFRMSHPSNKDLEWLKLIGMPGHVPKKTRVQNPRRTLGRRHFIVKRTQSLPRTHNTHLMYSTTHSLKAVKVNMEILKNCFYTETHEKPIFNLTRRDWNKLVIKVDKHLQCNYCIVSTLRRITNQKRRRVRLFFSFADDYNRVETKLEALRTRSRQQVLTRKEEQMSQSCVLQFHSHF